MIENDPAILDKLTVKQREVLDRLIEHKTSKEIARELGISPYTVDQRVQFAKEKLGVGTRSDAAAEYRRLMQLCEAAKQAALNETAGPTCEEFTRATRANPWEFAVQKNGKTVIALALPTWSKADRDIAWSSEDRASLDRYDGNSGLSMKLGIVVLKTTMLLFIAYGGLAALDLWVRSVTG